jgi:hypothetical protein
MLQVLGLDVDVAAKALQLPHLNTAATLPSAIVQMKKNTEVLIHEKHLLVLYTLQYGFNMAADLLWTSPGRAR